MFLFEAFLALCCSFLLVDFDDILYCYRQIKIFLMLFIDILLRYLLKTVAIFSNALIGFIVGDL